MAETSHAPYVEQLTELVQDFIRLKSHFKAVLPEDLVRLKGRLDELHSEGGRKHIIDYDLFYRIGIVLSRQEKPLTMGELSEALDVPLSTATRMADWLVESGYAERLSDPEDRRIVRLTLTEIGRDLYLTINAFITQRIEQILRPFTAAECRDMVALIRKLIKALEEAM